MPKPKKIVIIGPAHPLRGGLAAFDERLAKEFQAEGHKVVLYTFSLQYPSFLFPGKTQLSDDPAPADLNIKVKINSINPLNWFRSGLQIRKEKADIVVCRYWLPFMAPCLGTILRVAKRKNITEVIAILDNIIPHERRPGDRLLTHYFVRSCDRFIAMSESVMQDLKSFSKTKPAELIPHPLYDHFGAGVSKREARAHLGLDNRERIILFFGFIRKYKGLDLLLEAMLYLKAAGIRLLVAGEFYEDEKEYKKIIEKLRLNEQVLLHTHYISDEEVKYYFCAADLVVQPYRSATQSGITPMAYHFEVPMVVTNVGGLPERVPDKKVGLVTAATPEAIARAVKDFFSYEAGYFLPFIREEKKQYAWSRMTKAILNIGEK